MPSYLVTGGAGFIGSHITTALTERGDRVHVLDDLSMGRRENLDHLEVGAPGEGARVQFFEGSITDPELCRKACEGVDGVFHEAAQVSVPRSIEDPLASYAVNVTGTLSLLEAARACGVPRFVLAASSAAYGDSEVLPKVESMPPAPRSPYASGKLAAEELLKVYGQLFGIQTVALRYFNVFGPRQADDSPYTGVIALFARALLEGRAPTIFGDGKQSRDFTYIDDVVRANLLAMQSTVEPGTVINIGAGEAVDLLQLFGAMAEELGSALTPIHAETREGDVRHSLADLTLARESLGYEPSVHWRTGLTRTVAWYRDRFRA